jgi:hypothetical protein
MLQNKYKNKEKQLRNHVLHDSKVQEKSMLYEKHLRHFLSLTIYTNSWFLCGFLFVAPPQKGVIVVKLYG